MSAVQAVYRACGIPLILSGSARFLTVPTLSESLAGRAGFLDLWPLSLNERTGGPADFADRLFVDPSSLLASRESPWMRDAYLDLIAEGGYPEVLTISAQPCGAPGTTAT